MRCSICPLEPPSSPSGQLPCKNAPPAPHRPKSPQPILRFLLPEAPPPGRPLAYRRLQTCAMLAFAGMPDREPQAEWSMTDSQVDAAVSHWAPRFVANGVDYNDFRRVTAAIETWDSWCEQWCLEGAAHEQLGRHALAAGQHRSAGAHLAQAAVYYHFAKFMFVN